MVIALVSKINECFPNNKELSPRESHEHAPDGNTSSLQAPQGQSMGTCHVWPEALHFDLREPPGLAHTLTSQAAGPQDVVETIGQARLLTLTVPFLQEVSGAQHPAGCLARGRGGRRCQR